MGASGTRSTGGMTGSITTKALQESSDGFGVIAYVKGTNGATSCYESTTWNTSAPNFMYNQKVNYSSDHWTYTPVKFWPNDFANGDVDSSQGTSETADAQGGFAAGKVSFFAYAPYATINSYASGDIKSDLGSTVTSAFQTYASSATTSDGIVAISSNAYTGEPQVKYVLSDASLNNSVDLLWGIRQKSTEYALADGGTDIQAASNDIYNTDLTKQKVGETVDFLFKHALAKIGGNFYQASPEIKNAGLYVILDLDNGSQSTGTTTGTAINGGVKQDETLVTVSSIKIRDIHTYDTEISAPSPRTSNLVSSGWFNIAKGSWSETTTTGATYDFTLNTSSAESPAGTGFALNPAIKEGTPTWESAWKIDGTARTGVTTTAQSVFTDTSNAPALLLIPAPSIQTLIVSVTYTVRTRDEKLAAGWSENTQTITNEVEIPASALVANKYYKLLIHLGLTSIKFSATVADWDAIVAGGQGGDSNDDSHNKDIWLPSNTL